MKKSAIRMVLTAAVWGMGGCATSDPTRNTDEAMNGTARVHVVFANPERFTDARSSLGGGADSRNLDPLGRFLVREASKHLAPGERLIVVFHDVDLAGEFEPGGISATGDVRIVREIYAPRLAFSYSIVDQTDTVVQEGNVRLSNLSFLRELRSPEARQEPLHHEKKMLREWVRETLPVRRERSPGSTSTGDDHNPAP